MCVACVNLSFAIIECAQPVCAACVSPIVSLLIRAVHSLQLIHATRIDLMFFVIDASNNGGHSCFPPTNSDASKQVYTYEAVFLRYLC